VGTDGEIAGDSHFLLTVRLSVFILTTHYGDDRYLGIVLL